jgi:hypothetical protein
MLIRKITTFDKSIFTTITTTVKAKEERISLMLIIVLFKIKYLLQGGSLEVILWNIMDISPEMNILMYRKLECTLQSAC